MDIKEYRYILEIANAGGISKAAANLHISQPSLSAYLRNIEDRLGVRLFDVSHHSTVPTSAGEVYLDHARQIMGLDESLMTSIDSIKEHRIGRVRIGIPVTASSVLVPELMKRLGELYPQVEINFVEANSAELEEMTVNKRSLDFILASKPFLSNQLESILLFDERVVVVLPKSFRERVQPKRLEGFSYPYLEPEDMEKLPLTLMKPGHKLRQIADSYFLEQGMSPNIIHETSTSQTALHMVEAGLCGMFGYDSYAALGNMLHEEVDVYYIHKEPMTLQFVAAYLPSHLETGLTRLILDEVVKQVRETISGFVLPQ